MLTQIKLPSLKSIREFWVGGGFESYPTNQLQRDDSEEKTLLGKTVCTS